MKKLITLLGCAPALLSAQSLVTDVPQNRTALLEDFTGIHCGYCPEGHAIAATLEATLKDHIVVVGVHAGGYAVPQNGTDPDFRTPEGTAIDAHFTIGGYPAGVIDRHLFNGADDLGRGSWEGAVNEVLAMPSPVNVGVESTYDPGTHELTVHVHGYYTADSPTGNDYVSVLVDEDHLIGWQTDYGNGDHANYDHMHVLRHYLTDTWGENVGDHVAGDVVDRTYTYTVPDTWNIDNCKVVAFISEYQTEVYQVREVLANGGTTLVIGALGSSSPAYTAAASGVPAVFNNTFTNTIGADEDYLVSLTTTDAPAGWSAMFDYQGTDHTGEATLNFANGAAGDITVSITPDATPGIASYTLTVASVSNPNAPVLQTAFHVISGVHDLVVSNPQALAYEPIYMDGLLTEPSRARTGRDDLVAFAAANALGDVNNLYVNISWTFPCLTDALVERLAAFMDNGGNVMIAGQDIGWDQSGDANAYGTAATQAFYQNYLFSTFVSDGAAAQNQVNFEDADAVFGTVPNSAVNTVFGTGNNYPDHITPTAPAVAVLHYNDNGVGGLRAETTNHKVVYFGIGPEQMTDANVGHAMVRLSHDWFYGVVGVEQFDAAMDALGRPYPSPASTSITIPILITGPSMVLDVCDGTGRIVRSERLTNASTQVRLDVSTLANGLYTARLRANDGAGASVRFDVLH